MCVVKYNHLAILGLGCKCLYVFINSDITWPDVPLNVFD